MYKRQLVPRSGVIYFTISTEADLTAKSAITIPIAAGEPQKKPKGFPIGASKARFRACLLYTSHKARKDYAIQQIGVGLARRS